MIGHKTDFNCLSHYLWMEFGRPVCILGVIGDAVHRRQRLCDRRKNYPPALGAGQGISTLVLELRIEKKDPRTASGSRQSNPIGCGPH